MGYNWQTKIQYVKGIGPAKATELKGMGIETVGDLLEHQPNNHIYPGITAIKDLKEGHVIIKAKVVRIDRLPSHVPIVEAELNDGTGTCKTMWWNQIFILQNLRPGMTVTFWGKCKAGTLQQPKFSTFGFNADEVTGGDYGVHNRTMKIALKEVLDNMEIPDWSMGGYHSRDGAFHNLHKPYAKADYREAVSRLKYDELFLLRLAMLKRRQQARSGGAEVIADNDVFLLDQKILTYFPYEFTLGQSEAIDDIIKDLNSTTPMNRLLHGEVGSGKTAVAFYAAMLAALNGKRTLILCPTTILAQQHYDTLRGMGWDDVQLHQTGVDCGTHKVVIGTHSLLNAGYLLKSASLVIIDEFQKFGVEQRAKIQKYNPHTLLMSATPIPRTLAMSVFGDLDVTVIKELPIKRGTVVTRWVLPGKREQMYEIIDRELAKGKQVYVVYPRIDGGEDVGSAANGFTNLHARFKQLKCSLEFLTGRMSAEQKEQTLKRFRNGDSQILVSTIIAEVGLDNPNASIMAIEGADRFGLSQLHQLRGRICRSKDTTFCFMVSNTANEKAIARLIAIEQTNDGFEIAEADLRLRGPGEMFSTRQHGLPDLKFASLLHDYDLLVKARDLAKEYIGKLDEPQNAGIKEMLEIKFKNVLHFGDVV